MIAPASGRRLASLIGLVLSLALFAAPAAAQIPDTFTNLKVLPKTITKQELVGAMRGFSSALGVRCGHCHARPAGDPEGEIDWASDAKDEKQVAREMFTMMEALNTKTLPKIDTGHDDKVEITCRTCHHGQDRPIPIEDHLDAAYKSGGMEAMATRYEELRKEEYGSDTFNFSEWMLLSLGDKIAGREKPAEALQFAELNLRWFPESGVTYLAMAQAHAKLGQKDTAIEEIEKAVKLDEGLRENADHLLEQIKKE